MTTTTVRVGNGAPHHFWAPIHTKGRCWWRVSLLPRIPLVRARSMIWERPPELICDSNTLVANVECLRIADSSRATRGPTVWPRGLKRLKFGKHFNYPLAETVWPPYLQWLAFGHSFNQAIDAVAFPQSLEEILFGFMFDQPIHEVVWPASLKRITFGGSFNRVLRRLVSVEWPPLLESLVLGDSFNQPIHQVS